MNLHCQSGYGLAEAPVFVLTYFGVTRRRNVLQKVCNNCFKIAVEHQQELVSRLKNHKALLEAEFPRQKDDVVVMDPVEEIYEEEALPENVLEEVVKDVCTYSFIVTTYCTTNYHLPGIQSNNII